MPTTKTYKRRERQEFSRCSMKFPCIELSAVPVPAKVTRIGVVEWKVVVSPREVWEKVARVAAEPVQRPRFTRLPRCLTL